MPSRPYSVDTVHKTVQGLRCLSVSLKYRGQVPIASPDACRVMPLTNRCRLYLKQAYVRTGLRGYPSNHRAWIKGLWRFIRYAASFSGYPALSTTTNLRWRVSFDLISSPSLLCFFNNLFNEKERVREFLKPRRRIFCSCAAAGSANVLNQRAYRQH